MSDYTITILEALYEQAQRLAQESERPVEELIRNRRESALQSSRLDLPEDEQLELKAMAYMSDTALWTLAREQMAQKMQEQMQGLMQKNSLGTISEIEFAELEKLVDEGQRLILRKAEAMRLLIERGHQLSMDDLAPEND